MRRKLKGKSKKSLETDGGNRPKKKLTQFIAQNPILDVNLFRLWCIIKLRQCNCFHLPPSDVPQVFHCFPHSCRYSVSDIGPQLLPVYTALDASTTIVPNKVLQEKFRGKVRVLLFKTFPGMKSRQSERLSFSSFVYLLFRFYHVLKIVSTNPGAFRTGKYFLKFSGLALEC